MIIQLQDSFGIWLKRKRRWYWFNVCWWETTQNLCRMITESAYIKFSAKANKHKIYAVGGTKLWKDFLRESQDIRMMNELRVKKQTILMLKMMLKIVLNLCLPSKPF